MFIFNKPGWAVIVNFRNMASPITSVEVFNEIKKLSKRTLNQRPRILMKDIITQLPISQDALFLLLVELENRGLISIHKTDIISVSLSNYGLQEEQPPGGIDS